jgi:hypothetical protein
MQENRQARAATIWCDKTRHQFCSVLREEHNYSFIYCTIACLLTTSSYVEKEFSTITNGIIWSNAKPRPNVDISTE